MIDLTTHCAICGDELPRSFVDIGKALWDQDGPIAQYTSDRLEMLCWCTTRRPFSASDDTKGNP